MERKTFQLLALLVVAVSFTTVLAGPNTLVEKGRAHFNNPEFAGGRKSCSECHPGGDNLREAAAKTTFHIGGGEQSSLEEAINVCIVNANKGHAIDVNSDQMQELAAYIRSLGSR